MRHGFVRAAAVTPAIRVGDVAYNADQIRKGMEEAERAGASIVVFPELCLTGYTCSDLFLQEVLLRRAKEELLALAAETQGKDFLAFVGLPLEVDGRLYNVAAVLDQGEVKAFIPKTFIPNYSEFYEVRHFTKGPAAPRKITWMPGQTCWFGTDVLLACQELPDLVLAAEICEDVWAPNPPSVRHALSGATLLVNLSASDETTGKDEYRRMLIKSQSARLLAGYIYCSAGEGESSTDLVFSGHNLIAENGSILKESPRFGHGMICADLDVSRLKAERRRMTTFEMADGADYVRIPFSLPLRDLELERFIDPAPFVPSRQEDRRKRCEEIFTIQAMGLKKRLEHTGCKSAVIGISGGLDSTLALLVTSRAFSLLGLSPSLITAVTMPCFGTTDRTYTNACTLTKKLGASLKEVDIKEAVTLHFRDIEQDPACHDVTYENGQARERTQVLMDIANKSGGMVIGTGDMSELALGWATYNGDHMSMYGVNASVPKTLVRHLVHYYADTCGDEELKAVLYDILDTPVSPELLPPEDGKIAQKTEDIVGPYELHDFYLYYILRLGFEPAKIYRLARKAFAGQYDEETILKWLKVFYRRFFSQQFKRSCLPDGPKVGTVAVSPRGDLRMPSDASARLWLDELEKL